MGDKLRTVLVKFIVHHVRHPRALVIHSWLWLATQTDDLEEKRRCLKAIVESDPDDERASLALLLLDQRRPTS